MTTIAERVTAGAAFLDEHDPDWWREDVERAIDLDRLDLADSGRCILGQRCPLENPALSPFLDYAALLSGIDGEDSFSLGAWASELGFERLPNLDDGPYRELTAEWRKVITARREAAEAAS